MATYTCPDGHPSAAGDYCDVCGAPIGTPSAAGGATPPPLPTGSPSELSPSELSLDAAAPAAPAPATRSCPNCQAANPPDALFCEDCGYDFTTGQVPRPLDPPSGAVPVPAAPDVAVPPSPPSPPSPPTSAVEYVVEVWVDPDWYAAQDVTDPCPSPGMPLVVPLRERSVLVGRLSSSRNIHPEVDLSSDTGVSRRHAQLSTDGQRWWVEDLQSANGTYVGAAGQPLPTTPVPPGQRVELTDEARVYVGAWTRLVVRKAMPGDV